MNASPELKQAILGWFERSSRGGTKTKYYLKDVVKAFPDHEKREIQNAVNACIEDETLMWFSTGSTNLLVLPQYHKG